MPARPRALTHRLAHALVPALVPALVRAVRRLRRDRRGSVLAVTAAGALVVMGFASIGIDLGGIVLARRRAQGAVDLAALVAASNPAQAESLARRSLTDNGYGQAQSVTVSPGLYRADADLVPAARFTAGASSGASSGTASGASSGNAVRVLLRTAVQTHFGRLVGLPRMSAIEVTGTAAQAQFAALTLGSGTAALGGGIGNAVLGAMLGTKVSLTALDYTALLAAEVDALHFLDALAPSLGLSAGSSAGVLRARAGLGQVVGALRVAVQGEANAAPALAALGTLLGNLAGSAGSAAVPVARIADLGDAANLLGGAGGASPERGGKGPRIGVLDLIVSAANLGNGQRPIALDLGASVPGLLSTRLTLAVGERRQSSGWARPGGAGATVQTAQVRLLLEVGLTAPLGLGSLTLPVYAEVAPARASLRALTCPWSDRSERRAVVDAQPGLFTLAVADVPRPSVAIGTPGPDLGRDATLLSLPLVSVQARGRADLAAPASQSLTFTDADIARRATRGVASAGLAQSLTGSLLRSLTLGVNGADPGVIALLRPLLAPVLASAAPAIDGVLDSALRAVGVRVGYADVTVSDTVCSRAALVQ